MYIYLEKKEYKAFYINIKTFNNKIFVGFVVVRYYDLYIQKKTSGY